MAKEAVLLAMVILQEYSIYRKRGAARLFLNWKKKKHIERITVKNDEGSEKRILAVFDSLNETGVKKYETNVIEKRNNPIRNLKQALSESETGVSSGEIDASLLFNHRYQLGTKELPKKSSVRSSPTIPELEDIITYIADKRLTVSADEFFNQYQKTGWTVDSKPILSWKRCLEVWHKNAQSTDTQPPRSDHKLIPWMRAHGFGDGPKGLSYPQLRAWLSRKLTETLRADNCANSALGGNHG
jgi:hypothetical protein